MTSSLWNMRWNLDTSQQVKIEASLQYGWKEQSKQIGPCKHLPNNTVPPYREVWQLWIAMPKRHQVCEEKESMGGKKAVCRHYKYNRAATILYSHGSPLSWVLNQPVIQPFKHLQLQCLIRLPSILGSLSFCILPSLSLSCQPERVAFCWKEWCI